jgi:hypothetical protein
MYFLAIQLVGKKITGTLLSINGEFGANHVSCSSRWQCAKELMNIPAFGLLSNYLRDANIAFLGPANKIQNLNHSMTTIVSI